MAAEAIHLRISREERKIALPSWGLARIRITNRWQKNLAGFSIFKLLL